MYLVIGIIAIITLIAVIQFFSFKASKRLLKELHCVAVPSQAAYVKVLKAFDEAQLWYSAPHAEEVWIKISDKEKAALILQKHFRVEHIPTAIVLHET